MNQELNESQKILIQCLCALNCQEETITAIILLLSTEEQISEMADFLLNNRLATESDILKNAIEIAKTM